MTAPINHAYWWQVLGAVAAIHRAFDLVIGTAAPRSACELELAHQLVDHLRVLERGIAREAKS